MYLFRTWHHESSVCVIHKDLVDCIYRGMSLTNKRMPPIRYISRRVGLRDRTRRVLDSGLMHSSNSEMTFRELAKYGLGAKRMPNSISKTKYGEIYF